MAINAPSHEHSKMENVKFEIWISIGISFDKTKYKHNRRAVILMRELNIHKKMQIGK